MELPPPFEPPPCIFNQEERTIDSEVIGVGERVEEDRREERSEEEGEANATSPRGVLVARILNNQQVRSRGVGLRVTMEIRIAP
jgi:hypothetical protein